MPATNRFINWTGVKFTPSGGSATTFTGVTSVSIDIQAELVSLSGDADRFNTTLVHVFSDPMASITLNNLTQVNTHPPGESGSFEAIHNDATNGAGASSGALKYVLSNAMVKSNPRGGAHKQFGQSTITWASKSSDGTTSPLAVTVL